MDEEEDSLPVEDELVFTSDVRPYQDALTLVRKDPFLPNFSSRCLLFLSGVVCPIVFLAFFHLESVLIKDLWQDGQYKTKIALLLKRSSVASFLPAILLSVGSLGYFCIRPESEKYWWIRLGIYTGAFLSLHFCVLTVIATGGISLVFGLVTLFVAGPICWFLFTVSEGWVKRVLDFQFSIQTLLILCLLIGVFCVSLNILFSSRDLQNVLAPIIFGILGTPTFNAVAYTGLAIGFIFSRFDRKIKPPWKSLGLGWAVWIAQYIVAWRIAIRVMAYEYSLLPKVAPIDCFVSEAAASGHPWLVGTFRDDESAANRVCETRHVNRQMQDVKLVEFALKALSPRIHRLVRVVYNWIGPRLAWFFGCSRWFADLAYVALLPVQLFGKWIAVLANVDSSVVRRFYRTGV